MAPRSENDRPIVVWAGRVGHPFGYGAATRMYLDALRSTEIDLIVFDTVSGKIVGPDSRANFTVNVKDGVTTIAFDPGRAVIVVVHDTPERLAQFFVAGKVRLICATMFECDGIPAGWLRRLLRCDEVWVPSEFNRNTFIAAGVPSARIGVFPIPANPALTENAINPMILAQANRFRFLTVLSARDRKDFGLVLRSYLSEFSAKDDVSLIVKLPARLAKPGALELVRQAIFPEFEIGDPRLAHVLVLCADLDDERMWSLFAACDAYVSSDRAKGWDLPAFEAMQLGLVSIGVNWGGNTAFMTPENSVLVEPQPKHVLAGESLIANIGYYRGQSWAAIDSTELGAVMRRVFSRPEKYQRIRENARAVSTQFTGRAVAESIADRLDEFGGPDFRDNKTAVVRFKAAGFGAPRQPSLISADDLPRLYPDLLAFDPPIQTKEAWIESRRTVWGQVRVTPRRADLQRLKSLRNMHFGKRIFIVGNGPSLNQVNFDLLKDEYTFATNKIYLLYDRVTWRPSFYTLLDWRVSPDISDEVNGLRDSVFFFPQRFFGLLRDGEDVFWYESYSPGESLLDQFEVDACRGVRGGGSVSTAAIQIAYYLGFREFYLVGHDLTYAVPDSVIQSGGDRFGTGVQINLQSTRDDDVSHFDPRYFGAGARWHDPNIAAMKRGFAACRDAIEFHGGKIYNATHGGNLDVFPRVPFESLFSDNKSAVRKMAL